MKNKKGIIIIVVAFSVVVILGGILLTVFSPKEKPKSDEKEIIINDKYNEEFKYSSENTDSRDIIKFKVKESGNYNITISGIKDKKLFIEGVITNKSKEVYGSFSGKSYDKKIRQDLTYNTNFISNSSYEMSLSINSELAESDYEGSYKVTITRVGDIKYKEIGLNEEAKIDVSEGEEITYKFTPLNTGLYRVDWTNSESKDTYIERSLMKDFKEELNAQNKYQTLEKGKDYYFVNVISTCSKKEKCNILLKITGTTTTNIIEDEVLVVNQDMMLEYTSTKIAKRMVVIDNIGEAEITAYDSDGETIGVIKADGDKVISFDVDKDKKYYIDCKNVTNPIQLIITKGK